MKPVEIPLSRGYVAIVDADVADILSAHRWSALIRPDGTAYAHRRVNGRAVYMHRVIACAPRGVEVDHINGNKLDNRSENLRLATSTQNKANAGPRSGSYKGVSFDKARGQWRARVMVGGVERFLGRFASETDAARAYDVAAQEIFGEFARLNFQEGRS
jgi:hypothetical protein